MADSKNAIQVSILTLEKITTENAALVTGAAETLTQAVAYAAAVEQIQAALTPDVMARVFMPLKNRGRLGWRTDEANGKQYSQEQIRDAWTDALLRGALPINDEVILIGGNVYLEKNHFKRKLRQFPGLTDLKLHPGKVEMKPSGAVVEMALTCKIGGKDIKLDRTGNSAIPVRLNAGQGADAALGKAERKIMAQFYGQQTGSEITDEEEDFVVATNGTAELVKEPAKQLQSPPEQPKLSRADQTAAALKKARESKPQNETEQGDPGVAGDDGATPFDDESQQATPTQSAPAPITAETKPEQPKAATKSKLVGWVKDGATGETTKVTKEVAAEPAPQQAPAAPQVATPAAAMPPDDGQKSVTGKVQRVKAGRIGPNEIMYSIYLVGSDTKYITKDLIKATRAQSYQQDENSKQPGVKQPNRDRDMTILYAVDGEANVIIDLVDTETGETGDL